MALCLFLLFWEATRRLCPLQLAKTISTPYIYRMEISTITFDTPTVTVSAYLDFCQSLKVSRLQQFTNIVVCSYSRISQADQKYQDDGKFRMFRCQLFHSSLGMILEPLRSAMTTPKVTRCPDGHLRHVIYGLGPYIADYPEQVLLASVVQGWCPK